MGVITKSPFTAATAVLAFVATLPAFADFTYSQTTKITGGSMVRMMKMIPGGGKALEPQTTTHMYQGNRMAMISANSIQITDLDKETITEVNLEKRQYSVITFAEYKAGVEALMKKMSNRKRDKDEPEMNMDFKVDVKQTGATKNILGFNTKESILTITTEMKDAKNPDAKVEMKMDMDLWLAPSLAGYDEVRNFQVRFAQKIGINPEAVRLGRAAMMQPGSSQGMAKLINESSKLDGVPVLTIMKVGGMGGPGMPPPEAGAPPQERPNANEVAREEAGNQGGRAIGGAIGGTAGSVLGGLGGFGRRKKAPPKEEQPPAQPEPAPKSQAGPPPQAGSAYLMETTTELTSFTRGGVDAGKLSVPAGFKEVEHEFKKLAREAK